MIDLGDNHFIEFIAFAPDRELNPQLAHLPDDERCGATVTHNRKDGSSICESYIGLNRQLNTEQACWTVESWEPLTLSPSLLCTACGDHGFIREGKWVRA